MKDEYRAVLIGCGSRAPAHVDCYEQIPGARVVACCAPSPERRDALARRYGIKAYSDPAEMIQSESPHIVHLVTWPNTRVQLMSVVSKHRVPLCTVEKPIATAVSDWKQLVELEATTSTKFAVCHQFRWQPDLVRCQEAVRSGQIGKPLFLDMSAGMNIAGQGTHTLNYGRSLIGDPLVKEVFGSAHGWDTSDEAHPGPVETEAHLVFENGVRGLWTSGPVSPRCGDPSTVWQHVRAAAYGDRGYALYEEFGNWAVTGPSGIVGGEYGGPANHARNNRIAQAAFHRAMFEWLEGGPAPGTNLNTSLHEWKVVLALYQSAVDRRPIQMDGFEPADDLVNRFQGT